MKTNYIRMGTTVAQSFAALSAASAEIGARALRAVAADSARVAHAAADALRAPESYRGAATERVLRRAYDAQARQLHALRGASTLWGMAALRNFDAARRSEHLSAFTVSRDEQE